MRWTAEAVQALRESLRYSLQEFATHVGVSEKSVRNWEQGRHRPIPGAQRQLDATVQRLTSQERQRFRAAVALPGDGSGVGLLTSFPDLLAAMTSVVSGARQVLVTTGSRSAEARYLETIEQALRRRPALVHYRILFGPPRTRVLCEHLLALGRLRPLDGGPGGLRTLFVGVVEDVAEEPERFICASERQGVLAIPSLVTPGNFDTGVVLHEPAAALGLVQHVKQLYWVTRRLDRLDALAGPGSGP